MNELMDLSLRVQARLTTRQRWQSLLLTIPMLLVGCPIMIAVVFLLPKATHGPIGSVYSWLWEVLVPSTLVMREEAEKDAALAARRQAWLEEARPEEM